MADVTTGSVGRARRVALGQRLRQLREARGLTQEELAEQAGMHRAVPGHYERGDREPGISQVWRLADALGVTIQELLDGVEHPPV